MDLAQMNITPTILTPAIAAELLTKNIDNRRQNPLHVARLAEDMRHGRWMLSPDPIVIDTNGHMRNGQHRCQACVLADVEVPILMATGADPRSFMVMDIGMPRTLGQLAGIAGLTQGHLVTGAAKMMLRYERYPDRVWGVWTDITKAEVLEFATEKIIILPGYLHQAGKLPGMTRNTVTAAFNLILNHSENADDWDGFWGPVATGVGLVEGDPRLALRNRGINGPVQKFGSGQSDLWAMLKAWNAWVEGTSLKLIRVTPSMLPMPAVK
jgi:hypothetical protein